MKEGFRLKEETQASGVHANTRREFMDKLGRFVAVTPPAITFLLSTTLDSEAVSISGGHHNGGRRRKFRRWREG